MKWYLRHWWSPWYGDDVEGASYRFCRWLACDAVEWDDE